MKKIFILFTVLMIFVSCPALAGQLTKKEIRFWAKLDREIKKFQHTIASFDSSDAEKLERKINKLNRKLHQTDGSLRTGDIQQQLDYYKSDDFIEDFREEIEANIANYSSFNQFYAATMTRGQKTLCYLGKGGLGIATVAGGSATFLIAMGIGFIPGGPGSLVLLVSLAMAGTGTAYGTYISLEGFSNLHCSPNP